ncbi:MAG: class I SAM-dependent methyltransferase [Desulfobaccales bacterium]
MRLKPTAKKLHLGCGPTAKTPEGWLNLDASWNARLAKYPILRKLLTVFRCLPHGLDNSWAADIFIHDIRKPLPFEDNSFAGIYASHLLEHLYLDKAKALLKECYRVLEPRGVLRIVVPDLRVIINDYIKATENNSEPAGEHLHPADKLSQYFFIQYPSHNILYELYAKLTDFHSHKWMYDAVSLCGYFNWAGFVEVQEMQVQESRLTNLGQVEGPSTSGLVVEGIKPGG